MTPGTGEGERWQMWHTDDPRLTAARGDIAAKHLEGRVRAARFVEGVTRMVIDPQAPLQRTPAPDAQLETEALFGERVVIYDTGEEGWAWGQLQADGYVGWLPLNALGPPDGAPTHKVCALRTFIFPGPSIKLRPLAALSFASQVSVLRTEGVFAVTAAGGYIHTRHLAPLADTQSDPVAVAERFVGVPYLWGGKTSLGLDCSGLVQLALAACAIACPRDSDMQERALGEPADAARPVRGDLLFWKGHVAMVRDARTLIHANAFHMAVAIEPIGEAVGRIAANGLEVTSLRRLSALRRDPATG